MKKIIAVFLISLLMLQSCALEKRIFSLISDDNPDIPNIYPKNDVIEYEGYAFTSIQKAKNPEYTWIRGTYNQKIIQIGECNPGPDTLHFRPVYLYGDLEDSDAIIEAEYGTYIKQGFEFPELDKIEISAIYDSSTQKPYLLFEESNFYLEDIVDLSKVVRIDKEKELAKVSFGTKNYNFSILTSELYEYENQIYINIYISTLKLVTYKIKDEFQAEIRKNLQSR